MGLITVAEWRTGRAAELAANPPAPRPRRQTRPYDVRPFAFEPLEALVRAYLGDAWCLASVGEVLGSTARQVYRWRQLGLTVDQADVLAVAAGFHPAEVWPQWWSIAACEREAEA